MTQFVLASTVHKAWRHEGGTSEHRQSCFVTAFFFWGADGIILTSALKLLPDGHGVDALLGSAKVKLEIGGKEHSLAGPSGAMSTILPAVDSLLGIQLLSRLSLTWMAALKVFGARKSDIAML